MARKNRYKKHRSHHAPGTAPGTLKAVENAPKPSICVMAYSQQEVVEKNGAAADEIAPLLKKWPVSWIDVCGLGETGMAETLGEAMGLHRLALEDVFNLAHRAKAEDYQDHMFVVTRMPTVEEDGLHMEQISVFFGRSFVLTFQEKTGDVLDPVRERIRKGSGGRTRLVQADYLAYAVIDTIVDSYFPVLEHYSSRLNHLEDMILANPRKSVIEEAHDIKRDLQRLRNAMWPMREAVSFLQSTESKLIRKDTRPYLRDCYDHVIQVIDLLETYRERAAGLVDLYMSALSQKMNEIMKVLTIIATIFIPLSFISGVYGMNFNTDASPWNMPELGWAFGYPFALGLMLFVALALLLYFWRKGWIGEGGDRDA
ncbi:MAG: magnesium/cobalt transporter CorA [Alphaproteobacteria bacterium]|nr:magnesium/cobalt transporter CorA [Alphaproteobacteria bacterium]